MKYIFRQLAAAAFKRNGWHFMTSSQRHSVIIATMVIVTVMLFLKPGYAIASLNGMHVEKSINKAEYSRSIDEVDSSWKTYTVGAGEDFNEISMRANLHADDIQTILSLGKSVAYLKHLYLGDKIRLRLTKDKQLLALEYDFYKRKRLSIKKTTVNKYGKTLFDANIIERPVDKKLFVRKSGVIKNSLFQAGKSAGLSAAMTMELARIFDWDIDFSRDVRKGDSFTVIYSGEEASNAASIMAAEFINNGKVYRAVHYKNSYGRSGYFRPDGKSIKQNFLRNPVDYPLISSRFNLHRKHPILSTIRAHKGVDYAAKTGTPIKAVADGQISFRGRQGGYGKTIIIEHEKDRSTLYAHMQKFAMRTQLGHQIKQGQVIGYVGQSGLATGPHLHYEFRVSNKHVDPLKVKIKHNVIPDRFREDFAQKTQMLLGHLGGDTDKIYIALNTAVSSVRP